MWKGHPWYLYEKGYPDIWMEKGKPDICMEPVAGGSTYFWDFTRLSVISTPGEHQSSSPSTRAVFWEQTLWNKQCKHHHQLWVVDLHRLGNILVIKVKSSQKRGCSSLTPPCYKACYEGSTKGQAGSRTRDLMDRSRKTWPRYFEPKSSIKVDVWNVGGKRGRNWKWYLESAHNWTGTLVLLYSGTWWCRLTRSVNMTAADF